MAINTASQFCFDCGEVFNADCGHRCKHPGEGLGTKQIGPRESGVWILPPKCSWCGEVVEDTAESMKEHFEICEMNPSSVELRLLRAEIAELRRLLDQTTEMPY